MEGISRFCFAASYAAALGLELLAFAAPRRATRVLASAFGAADTAILVDYRHVARATVTSSIVEGRDDCVSWDFEGGLRGRLWIDEETHEVLRLDQHLAGLVDIPLPREVTRWPGRAMSFTLERWDTTIRFRRVTFTDPDETLTLPVSMTSMRIVRGSGNPRKSAACSSRAP